MSKSNDLILAARVKSLSYGENNPILFTCQTVVVSLGNIM